jgi:hypothetical protein
VSGDPNRPESAVLGDGGRDAAYRLPTRLAIKVPRPPERYMDFLQKVHELMLSVGNDTMPQKDLVSTKIPDR